MNKFITIILTILFLTDQSLADNASNNKFGTKNSQIITIGTGSITGLYYPAGGAICRMINLQFNKHHIRCSVEATSGSLFNIQSLNNGQVEFAIVQSDVQYEAYNGIGNFASQGKNHKLRSVFSIHDDSFTVVARAGSGIKSFEDIKGKRVNIGTLGSGSRSMIENLIKLYGWKTEDFPNINEFKASEQPEALCNNKIDVMIFSVGHPNGAVQEAATTCATEIIPVQGPKIKEFLKLYPYYVETVVPGGIYAGNKNDINTFGAKATIVTTSDIKDDVIYQIVKSVFEGFSSFKFLHPVFSSLTIKKMIKEGNTIPLHNGATKYFNENDLLH
jgi:TRAP transporter TAXI family solute receptor